MLRLLLISVQTGVAPLSIIASTVATNVKHWVIIVTLSNT